MLPALTMAVVSHRSWTIRYSLFISGNYAYVASSQDNRFEIVDVTDPENPVHKGSIQDSQAVRFLIIRFAYSYQENTHI